jgi:allene oxide cyclase-like protein
MPAPPAPPGQTITLIGIEVANSRPEVQPRPANTPHGDQLGDQRVFTDDLSYQDGQPAGQHSGFCTLVRVGPGNRRTYQCLATFALPDGQITGRGLITFPLAGQIKFAITGGTETHRHARGEITATFPAANRTDFTLRLN